MSAAAFLQIGALLLALGVTVPLVSRYLAQVYGARDDGTATGDRFFEPIEGFVYRLLGVDPDREQRWRTYAVSLLAFSLGRVIGG
jgi:K+-transporting ATPase ATPase A chain